MLVDTHAHISDEVLSDKEGLIKRFEDAGGEFIIDAGNDVCSSAQGKELSEKFENVFFTAGIHPSCCESATEKDYYIIEEMCKHEKAVALGEIGLDYHYGREDREKQKRAFTVQLEMAASLSLPVVIHSRDACEDTANLLIKFAPKLAGVVLHCFSGSAQTALKYTDMGFYISFAGPVTFKNNKRAAETVPLIASDRILYETDCPYLAPEPLRGKTNEPSFVQYVARRLSQLRNVDYETFCAKVKDNSLTIFKKIELYGKKYEKQRYLRL